jgi:acid stress-induced BolA-like protein IbaG/YrbA
MTREDLLQALITLPLESKEVSASVDGRRLIGVVVSAEFEGMDEAQRQRIIWNHLHKSFHVEDLVRVEFVFTNTPAESKELAS